MATDVNLTFKISTKRILPINIGRKKTNSDEYNYIPSKHSKKRHIVLSKRWIRKKMRITTRIAEHIVKNKFQKDVSTKTYKHYGEIHSNIINNTIQKYKYMKGVKGIRKNVNLVASYHYGPYKTSPPIIHDKQKNIISIKQFKGMTFKWKCPVDYNKICIAELNKDYLYIVVTVTTEEKKNYLDNVGVDLNIKGNLASVGNPKTREAKLLGEGALGKRVKYLEIRRRWQKQKKNLKIKRMGNKESRVMRSLNHTISKEIVDYALENGCNINMEDLTGIRKAKTSRSFRKFLHSWAFYELRTMVEYKANLAGIETSFVDPKYTSQDCSVCGERTKVQGKKYVCNHCGTEMHRDINACFNIAMRKACSRET